MPSTHANATALDREYAEVTSRVGAALECELPRLQPWAPEPRRAGEALEAAERVVASVPGGPTIQHRGLRAAYSPADDAILMPKPGRFESRDTYYSTLFPEEAHATGHP